MDLEDYAPSHVGLSFASKDTSRGHGHGLCRRQPGIREGDGGGGVSLSLSVKR